ncbi:MULTISPECIES: flagellar biosynthetic protein FliR [Gammaproteobacteria]|uniref:flagellar biosynthetic protein FliR n=1 Tax=Gammaproteobacteria TaxID=1236 RepID=UPI000DCFB562|nr:MULTISPECIES: flagellar biosynthetic protein FliR [Gammaproteobacteria]RTE85450.1 flagellar type III secretion system protein FliR [Aliidiomarina sp. B3213]TCZ89417.1 flagellar type III secretion system protein FliR [Lysobacter sp. N42]
MEIYLDTILTFFAQHFWPFVRVGGMFMTMALLSGRSIPTQIKLFAAVAITIGITPALPPVEYEFDTVSALGMFITAQQVLIGMLLGIVSLMVINTFTLAGQILGMQIGLGFAAMVDPSSGQQVPVLAQFYLLLASLMFLAFDGHLMMIRIVAISFDAIPIGPRGPDADALMHVVEWASWMYSAGMTFALSAVIAILAMSLAFGVMTRAAPQLNIFTIGFPIKLVSGLIILWLTIGNFTRHFEAQWQRGQEALCFVLGGC